VASSGRCHKRRKNLLFLKKKKQKDFYFFVGLYTARWVTVNLSFLCGRSEKGLVAGQGAGTSRQYFLQEAGQCSILATYLEAAPETKVFLLLFLQKKKNLSFIFHPPSNLHIQDRAVALVRQAQTASQ
jgi:hypothetical protein